MSKRKLAFYEVDHGRLGEVMQENFEKAQAIAHHRGVEVKCKFEILVYPPDPKEPLYSGVSYSHQIVQPPHKSRKYEMVVDNEGRIISDAEHPLEQLNLQLTDQNIEAEHRTEEPDDEVDDAEVVEPEEEVA